MSNINRTSDQRGVASILVSLIMLIIISLIVVGFAQVTRRNQRQVLDQQLASQAYYAAETGINDARRVVINTITSGGVVAEKNGCGNTVSQYSSLYTGSPAKANLASGVSYSCLLVDPSPESLIFSSINQQASTVTPITVNDNLRTLTFSWTADGNQTDPKTCYAASAAAPSPSITTALPNTSNWQCDYGLLRVDLVQLQGPTYSADTLDDRTVTFYLKPSFDASTTSDRDVPNFTGDRAYQLNTRCVAGTCSITVNFTTAASQTRNFYARLTAQYHDAKNVTINGTGAAGDLQFSGAQAMIDSTGKAQDQLKRIQVRVPLTGINDTLMPGAALQTHEPICKRYIIAPNLLADPSLCAETVTPVAAAGPVTCTPTLRELVAVMDESSSMDTVWSGTLTRLQSERRLMGDLVDNMNLPPVGNRMAIVKFNTEAFKLQDLTINQTLLHAAVDQNTTNNRSGTYYLEGMRAAEEYLSSSRVRPGALKFVVFMSDGQANDFGILTPATVNAINARSEVWRSRGYNVFTVAINLNNEESVLLQNMAVNDGEFYPVNNDDEFQSAISSILTATSC